jgi:uncharacterized protein YecT (DUF1311 family)
VRGPLLLAVAGLAGADAATAQPCTDRPSQGDMSRCAAAAYKRADAELNEAYRKILTRLVDDAEAKRRLVAAQRAWIAFRDAECAFATAPGADGSVYPYLLTTCLAGLTEARLGQLQVYLDCREGDLACPVPAGGR